MAEDREPLSSEEMIRRARRGLGSQPDPADQVEDEPLVPERRPVAEPSPPLRRARARRTQRTPQVAPRPAARTFLAVGIAVALLIMGIVFAVLFGSAAG